MIDVEEFSVVSCTVERDGGRAAGRKVGNAVKRGHRVAQPILAVCIL